jgi:ABC-type multidrug transport system permease subunit
MLERPSVVYFRELHNPPPSTRCNWLSFFSCLCVVATLFTLLFVLMTMLILGFWMQSIASHNQQLAKQDSMTDE